MGETKKKSSIITQSITTDKKHIFQLISSFLTEEESIQFISALDSSNVRGNVATFDVVSTLKSAYEANEEAKVKKAENERLIEEAKKERRRGEIEERGGRKVEERGRGKVEERSCLLYTSPSPRDS
eukprot:TRINITY_DN9813_c0_g1_i3.p2 TRINITY_DN9813_c0_g1~~TRINITY_DN9813_c0_g1_i3.p2  ORF type:complete len:126 (+),score=32.83 TRINITY_DN9813_c0_g1_i3:97-474(+)